MTDPITRLNSALEGRYRVLRTQGRRPPIPGVIRRGGDYVVTMGISKS